MSGKERSLTTCPVLNPMLMTLCLQWIRCYFCPKNKAQLFLKTIQTLSCWYSLDSSCWALSDEYPCARVSIISVFLPHLILGTLATNSIRVNPIYTTFIISQWITEPASKMLKFLPLTCTMSTLPQPIKDNLVQFHLYFISLVMFISLVSPAPHLKYNNSKTMIMRVIQCNSIFTSTNRFDNQNKLCRRQFYTLYPFQEIVIMMF